jgi:hypothetical protein
MDKPITIEMFMGMMGLILTLIAVLYKYSYNYTQKNDKTVNENKDIALKDALRIKEEADKEIREMRINYTKKFTDLGVKIETVENGMSDQFEALKNNIEHLFATQENNTIRAVERLEDKVLKRIDTQDQNNLQFFKEYLPILDTLKKNPPPISKPRKRQASNGVQ